VTQASSYRLAWRQVWPPAAIFLGLVLVLSRPIGPWTAPIAAVSAGSLWLIGRRSRETELHELARYIAGFVIFTALRHYADDLGPPAYIRYPIVIDRWLGGGVLPTARLQATTLDLSPLAWRLYVSYFFVPPLVVGIVWRCWPQRLRAYVSATLALFAVSAVIHIVIPTAPPWLAARLGAAPGVRAVVLDHYHVTMPAAYQAATGISANLVAAMPSVHLAVTTLIVCVLWETPLRWPSLAYLLAMFWAIVYSGDHYVVDGIAGILLAIASWRWATAARLPSWTLRARRSVPQPKGARPKSQPSQRIEAQREQVQRVKTDRH
jgi:hypothetical protein